jgi:hypothetical protein
MVPCGIKRCPPTPFDINRLQNRVVLSRQRSRVRVSSSPPFPFKSYAGEASRVNKISSSDAQLVEALHIQLKFSARAKEMSETGRGVARDIAEKTAMKAKKKSSGGKQATIVKKSGSQGVESASRLIDARIEELGDWRGEMLSRLRALIKQADPEVVEEWKWRTPVWSHDGLICTGETYKNVVKMTFAKGASLDDPSGLFNSSLEGRVRRAIDFREGGTVNEKALKTLIRAAVVLNTSPASQG